jgi:hypothetical protein
MQKFPPKGCAIHLLNVLIYRLFGDRIAETLSYWSNAVSVYSDEMLALRAYYTPNASSKVGGHFSYYISLTNRGFAV